MQNKNESAGDLMIPGLLPKNIIEATLSFGNKEFLESEESKFN